MRYNPYVNRRRVTWKWIYYQCLNPKVAWSRCPVLKELDPTLIVIWYKTIHRTRNSPIFVLAIRTSRMIINILFTLIWSISLFQFKNSSFFLVLWGPLIASILIINFWTLSCLRSTISTRVGIFIVSFWSVRSIAVFLYLKHSVNLCLLFQSSFCLNLLSIFLFVA